MKHIRTLRDLNVDEMREIVKRTVALKERIKRRETIDSLKGRVVGLLFEKPSTRTRAGFEAATIRLGGNAIYLASSELQLKRGEPIKDVARILGSYLDVIVARVYEQQTVDALAEHAGIPVINGLSDLTHPTQILCDFATLLEARGELSGLRLAYVGDGNNICNSLLIGCAMMGIHIAVAHPKGYAPDQSFLDDARAWAEKMGSEVTIVEDPREAAKGADVLYADTWVSMGEDAQKEQKIRDFQGYQINRELLALAKPDAQVMHCLPAYRGYEITEEVLEGPQSIAWEQGANKMYGAAGILDALISNEVR